MNFFRIRTYVIMGVGKPLLIVQRTRRQGRVSRVIHHRCWEVRGINLGRNLGRAAMCPWYADCGIFIYIAC